ncbi:MAG: FAD-binding protein [Actinoallomurus sp.]|jgi:succinate dehydrogenase / fumarate reductase flavoprotein subunit|nr:FAD-binding protein [Actinoallomurus sp.]
MGDHHRTEVSNVLIIGMGCAGLRAAIAANMAGCEVTIIGKRPWKDAHTVLAAGGINAALGTVDPQDSWQQHFADTLKEGYFLGIPRMVEIMAKEAPAAVLELADWGCPFSRTPDGRLDQRFFGAHKYRRTCYAGDYTGRAVLDTLADKVSQLHIASNDTQYVSQLLVHDGVCFGALAFDLYTGERTVYGADAVVLATGGGTRLWRRSSSRRDENTGDGMYLALRAGCTLGSMELVQFHPTGMVWPEETAGALVTEAVRGEGGRLYNSDHERFMERYDPERLELSTRDCVALANYTEIMAGRGGPHNGVFLDISHRDKDYILEKLPRTYRQFMETELLDISRQPMEVAPTAHYTMGGVMVDAETHATAVTGLYAVGEVTNGLHGANRLGGNSLAETVVFGRRAGEDAAKYSRACETHVRSKATVDAAFDDLDSLLHKGDEMARPLQRSLRDTLWECAGVVRNQQRMEQGLEKVADLTDSMPRLDVRPSAEGYQDLAHALDLRASLLVAQATLLSAIERRESRGAHQRSDYPEQDPDLKVNFTISLENGELVMSRVPVPEMPEHLKEWETMGTDVEPVEGRLLE